MTLSHSVRDTETSLNESQTLSQLEQLQPFVPNKKKLCLLFGYIFGINKDNIKQKAESCAKIALVTEGNTTTRSASY